ncbi:MAG: phage tail tape measure protein [Candidatus Sedimenticola sp. (ex Thyasira tokunagai)]
MAVANSAKLDKQLVRISQTAGVGQANTEELRKSLFNMARETGQSLSSLTSGFDNLIQAGLDWEESLATIRAINPAMAVTGSQAGTLASGMTVAAQAFQFDLSKPKIAVDILDKMTVAGRLGNAELEDLSGVFARIGINAKAANLSFSETLGLVERLSLVEKNPERLSTLVDSTLRLFTNQQYLKQAAKATGVSFYDADGERRAALDVLEDISKKYKKLKKGINKDKAIQAAFGKADLDTIKGLRALLSGNTLSDVRKMADQISGTSGVIKRDLDGALGNAVDQVSRLKSVLHKAADGFSRPINSSISRVIKYALDKKKDGGLEASGTDLMIGGGLAVGGGLLARRFGGNLLKGLAGKFGNVAGGVATGKALEQAAGVMPVYVVNMPASLGGSLPGGLSSKGGALGGLPKSIPKVVGKAKSAVGLLVGAKDLATISAMGTGAIGTAGAAVGVAGAVGYGVGTLIYKAIEGTDLSDKIGESVAKALAFFGNKEAKISLEINEKRSEVKHIETNGIDLAVDTGMTMVGP